MDSAYNIQQYLQGHPKVVKGILIGMVPVLSITSALGLTSCKEEEPTIPEKPPYHTEIPTENRTLPTKPIEEPKPEPEPKSIYKLAQEELDYKTAQHWKDVARNYNSEQAINELVFIPEEGRLVLAKDIGDYTADKTISDKELSDLADPDRDGIKSSYEANNGTNPMDPSNTTQEISQKTFSYVRNLAKYNDSQGNGKALPEIYSGLEKAIYVVENQPKIVNGLDIYGVDFLAQFLSNKDAQEALQNWRGVNALGLPGQIYFYNLHWDTGPSVSGTMTNKKLDTKEKEIVDKIWQHQIEYQKNGERLIPMDDSSVELWQDEDVQINNLRQSLLPWTIFTAYIDNPGKRRELGWDTYNTNTWVDTAFYNVSQLPQVHDEIWSVLKDPQKYQEALDEFYSSFADPRHNKLEAQYKTYVEALVEEGSDLDKLMPAIIGLSEGSHENYVENAILRAWAAGGASYRVESTILNDSYPGGLVDGKQGFPVSDAMRLKLSSDESLYGIPLFDDNTNVLPGRYSEKNLIIEDGARFVKLLLPKGWVYLFGSK